MVIEGEFWDDEEIADYLGIQVQSIPRWLNRHKLQRNLVISANEVIGARRGEPGQGTRTDLKERPPRVRVLSRGGVCDSRCPRTEHVHYIK